MKGKGMVVTKDAMNEDIDSLNLLAGYLCLDFVNTVDPRLGDEPRDYLCNYFDLLAWSRRANILSRTTFERLQREAERHPGKAKETFLKAIHLREAMYEIFARQVEAKGKPRSGLTVLNSFLSEVPPRIKLLQNNQGFVWEPPREGSDLTQIMWPIVWSAADLLVMNEFRAVKMCQGVKCGWLFLDKSRSGNRSWCNMKGCGNRAKASRFYKRTKRQRKK